MLATLAPLMVTACRSCTGRGSVEGLLACESGTGAIRLARSSTSAFYPRPCGFRMENTENILRLPDT